MPPTSSRWRDLTSYLSNLDHLHNLVFVLAGGYALGLWVWEQGHSGTLGSYILTNLTGERPSLGGLLLAAGLAFAVWLGAGLVVSRLSGRALDPVLNAGSGVLLLGVLAPFGPVLATPGIETERPLFLFGVVVLMALVAGLAAREMVHPFAPSQPGPPNERGRLIGLATIVALAIGYAVYMSLLTVGRHNNFLTHSFDLGIHDQALWNLLHNGYMRSTQYGYETINYIGDHFSPIFFLLAPVYALYQDARNLLIMQSAALAAAAVPIYLLAYRKLGSVALALALSASYLLAPAVHGANTFDFHQIALVTVLLATTLYALEAKKDVLFLASLVLALMVKEEVALSGAAIGLYLIIAKRRYRLGSLVAAACLAYFVLVIKVVMPGLGGVPQLHRFEGLMAPESGGLSGVVRTLVTNPFFAFDFIFLNPAKLAYLTQLLLPVLFTPLGGGLGWIAAIPAFAVPLLASTETQFSIIYHYSAHLLPFVYFLAVLGLVRWTQRPGRNAQPGRTPTTAAATLAAAILVSSLALNYSYGWVFSKQFEGMPQRTSHAQVIDGLMREQIPDGASVSAMSDLVPHLTNREDIYLFPVVSDAEYVIMDTDKDANFWPYEGGRAPSDALAELLPYMASGAYGLVAAEDNVLVLKKGAGGDAEAAVRQALATRFEAETLPGDLAAPDLPSAGASRGIARRATPDLNRPDGKSALVFGPYTRLYPGRYRLDFLMKTEGDMGPGPLATVDVFSHLDGYPRASREVTTADFPQASVWTPVSLEFDLDKTVDDLEFRVLYSGEGELWLDAIQVTPVAVQLPPEMMLER